MFTDAGQSLFDSKLSFSRILDSFYGTFLAVFPCLALTPPKVNGFWSNLEHSETLEYIVGGWPRRQILGAIRAVLTTGEPGEILFFSSGKQHMISPISHRLDFTKFEHNTSIGVMMKTFGTEFWKF